MPKFMAAFILNSIYKKLYLSLSLSLAGLWRARKILILKTEAEGILSKKTSRWIVLGHHVGYEARNIQERIMSKKGG